VALCARRSGAGLGRSQYTADSFFVGSIDEFRIYNRALSEGEVRYLAGDR